MLFTLNGTSSVPDTTGTIGVYAHGNEPSHHVILWLLLLGDESAAYHRLEQVMSMYTSSPDGLPGNDDAGQLSAWYVCVALGLFPVDPTSGAMLHFRPRVRSFVLRPQAV